MITFFKKVTIPVTYVNLCTCGVISLKWLWKQIGCSNFFGALSGIPCLGLPGKGFPLEVHFQYWEWDYHGPMLIGKTCLKQTNWPNVSNSIKAVWLTSESLYSQQEYTQYAQTNMYYLTYRLQTIKERIYEVLISTSLFIKLKINQTSIELLCPSKTLSLDVWISDVQFSEICWKAADNWLTCVFNSWKGESFHLFPQPWPWSCSPWWGCWWSSRCPAPQWSGWMGCIALWKVAKD